jgi:hypothetical protein
MQCHDPEDHHTNFHHCYLSYLDRPFTVFINVMHIFHFQTLIIVVDVHQSRLTVDLSKEVYFAFSNMAIQVNECFITN